MLHKYHINKCINITNYYAPTILNCLPKPEFNTQ